MCHYYTAKYMGHGSCMVGRELLIEWVSGSQVTVDDLLSALVFSRASRKFVDQ